MIQLCHSGLARETDEDGWRQTDKIEIKIREEENTFFTYFPKVLSQILRALYLIQCFFHRFFLKIHHQFLKGLHTRKSLEELLRLIADNVMEHRK